MLPVPVANQPLAGQRAHGVVPALGWTECHRYVPKWPRTLVSETSPQRLFCCCICCSEGVGHPSSLFQNFSLDFLRVGKTGRSSPALLSDQHHTCTAQEHLGWLPLLSGWSWEEMSAHILKGCLGWLAWPSVQPSCGCEEQKRTSHVW